MHQLTTYSSISSWVHLKTESPILEPFPASERSILVQIDKEETVSVLIVFIQRVGLFFSDDYNHKTRFFQQQQRNDNPNNSNNGSNSGNDRLATAPVVATQRRRHGGKSCGI